MDTAVLQPDGVAHVHEALPAAFHCLSDLPAEPGIGKRGTAGRAQFPVEPGRAVASDLLVKAVVRQDAYSDIRTVPRKIVGLTTRGKIGGNAPMIGVDPLGMAGPTQRFQPADVRANEGLGIAADTVDGTSRPLQMLGRAIDASLTCDIQDVAVRGARTGGAEPATTIMPRPTSSSRAASIS